ncbi:MAG: hypothetical protein WCP45_15905 [Verrucomicrobiota bacterium]
MFTLQSMTCTRPRVAKHLQILTALVVGCALVAPCHGATSIQNFVPASNDRFANNPAFIGGGLDWSGVGRDNDGGWGTMLTPTVFLSAAHAHPGVGSLMSFFPANDPSAAAVTRTVTGGHALGTSDLWVGTLSAALPPAITHYQFCQIAASAASFAASVLNDLPIFMGGISPTSSGYGAVTATVQTVGTNRLEGFMDGLAVNGSTGDVLLTVQNLTSDTAFGFTVTGFEAQLVSGDSGSPLMIQVDGRLVLGGIAWAVATDDIDPNPITSVNRPLSAFSYTGSHTAEILALIPEPALPWFLLPGAALLAVRRRTS